MAEKILIGAFVAVLVLTMAIWEPRVAATFNNEPSTTNLHPAY